MNSQILVCRCSGVESATDMLSKSDTSSLPEDVDVVSESDDSGC